MQLAILSTLVLLTLPSMGGGLAAHDTIKPSVRKADYASTNSNPEKPHLEVFSIYNPHKEVLDKVRKIKHDLWWSRWRAHLKNVAIRKEQAKQKAARRQPQPVAAIRPVYHAPPKIAGCGDNQYAKFIYKHESSCNLNAVNPGGCRGIGQACPGSKLPCGADYACQNAFFTNYAISRYGSWEGAYNAWISKGWW